VGVPPPKPFLLPLFTEVLISEILGTCPVRSSRKFANPCGQKGRGTTTPRPTFCRSYGCKLTSGGPLWVSPLPIIVAYAFSIVLLVIPIRAVDNRIVDDPIVGIDRLPKALIWLGISTRA
jgi:hypothetical protein